jgi:TetR/AcrR family transcriptional regulator, tetracycline repressor protein
MSRQTRTRQPHARRAPPIAIGLTREAIVEAALAEIDSGGPETFSVRGLARRLGVNPNVIVWHVGNRDVLLAEVVALLLRDIRPARQPGEPWQAWLRALFDRYRALIRRHPNAASLVGAEMVSNARPDFDLVEAILATLAEAGFPDELLGNAYCAVEAAVVGFTTQEFARMPPGDVADWREEMQARMRGVDPAVHPTLARHLPRLANRAFVLRWQNGAEAPLDGGFEVFVDCVISGLETLLGRSRRR